MSANDQLETDRTTRTVAWTAHDGPGAPPSGPPRLVGGVLAAAMLAGGLGMMSSGALCPEHRIAVLTLASVVLAGSLAVGTAIVMGRPVPGWLALLPAAAGVAIGLIDMTHDATRGLLLAIVWGVALLTSLALVVWNVRAARWRRAVARDGATRPDLSGLDAATSVVASDAPVDAAAEAPTAADARVLAERQRG